MADHRRDIQGAAASSGTKSGAPFRIAARVKSFRYAVAGVVLVIRSQHNAWIHSVASLLVLALAVVFPLSRLEWCALILAIVVVWSAEGMNTALELLADAVSSDHHPLVGQAKDAAAGAVLFAALGAAVVGGIILGPYCLDFLRAT